MSKNDPYPPEEENETPLTDEPEQAEAPDTAIDTDLLEERIEEDQTEEENVIKQDIPIEALDSDELDEEEDVMSSGGKEFPPGHLDVASNVRAPNEQEKIMGRIMDEFEKIDDVAEETGFRLESSIAKEEILQGDEAAEEERAQSAQYDEKPAWKAEAEQRYNAQEAKRQRLLEERRKLDEERRQKREAHQARMKVEREAYEQGYLSERAEREARMRAEREAADARLKAERDAKLKARQAYEAQQHGEYSPESKVMPAASDPSVSEMPAPAADLPVVKAPDVQPEQSQPVESPVAQTPAPEKRTEPKPTEREREAVNRLGKPPSVEDES